MKNKFKLYSAALVVCFSMMILLGMLGVMLSFFTLWTSAFTGVAIQFVSLCTVIPFLAFYYQFRTRLGNRLDLVINKLYVFIGGS